MDPHAIRAWFDLQGWPVDGADWERQRKGRWAWRKFRRARRWARVLARVPGVRMIAIGNALGYGNCHDASDIDLVIVTAPRRIWTARLCVVAILKLFRQRPGEHARDALCPSFFLATDALNLESLQIGTASAASNEPTESGFAREGAGVACGDVEKPGSEARASDLGGGKGSVGKPGDLPTIRDPYLLFWITQLTVLYDREQTYAKFWAANAAWVRQWLPDAEPRAVHPRLSVSPHPRRRGSQRGWDRLGDSLEYWAKQVQEPRLRRIFPRANGDSSTIIRDDMLKFHANDRRAAFRDAWLQTLDKAANP